MSNTVGEIVEGAWYDFTAPSSTQLSKGQRVKVLEVGSGEFGVIVWSMGPARTVDEAGIAVRPQDLGPVTGSRENTSEGS